MFLNALILSIIIIFLYLYWFHIKAFYFFEKRKIAHIKPNIIFGNITEAFFKKLSLIEVYSEIYRKVEPHRIGGLFNFYTPFYIVCDPELIKNIVVKNFEYFTDRFLIQQSNHNLISNRFLGSMSGEEWKAYRVKLTPVFSSGKLKMMFPLIKTCGNNLMNVLNQFTPEDDFECEDICIRFSSDIMAACTFGMETNTLENSKSELLKLGRQYLGHKLLRYLRDCIQYIWPKIVKIIDCCILNKKAERFYYSIVLDTIKHRETNKIIRNDLLDLLIRLKNDSNILTDGDKCQDESHSKELKTLLSEIGNNYNKIDIKVTDEFLIAQAIAFLTMGSHLNAKILSSSLLELALNPEVQDKVRNEITSILKNNGDELTYEIMKQMKYTDMVIAETLRKYPSIGFTQRRCVNNYKVPGMEIVINKDDQLIIPIYAIHMNEKFYEKPDKFYPEHFTKEAIAGRPQFTYLPFGEGPRKCIASRFVEMQVKASLICMLRNFSFSVSPRMKLPVRKKPILSHSFEIEGGLWLKCKKI